MNPRLTLLPLALIVSTAQAQLAETAGFSGEISLNAGFVSSESHFNTDNSSTINSLDQSAESDSSFIAAPLGNIAYTFGSKLQPASIRWYYACRYCSGYFSVPVRISVPIAIGHNIRCLLPSYRFKR